jgi:RNA polymerase sigma-70 factor (ECF subfamily)
MAGLLGLTARDIAEREHIPIRRAKTRVRRALHRLRAHLVTDPVEHVVKPNPTRKETNAPAATLVPNDVVGIINHIG